VRDQAEHTISPIPYIAFSFDVKNRYLMPLGFVVNIVGGLSLLPSWIIFHRNMLSALTLPTWSREVGDVLYILSAFIHIHPISEVCRLQPKITDVKLLKVADILSGMKEQWQPLVSV
jgi:hypothetical protein